MVQLYRTHNNVGWCNRQCGRCARFVGANAQRAAKGQQADDGAPSTSGRQEEMLILQPKTDKKAVPKERTKYRRPKVDAERKKEQKQQLEAELAEMTKRDSKERRLHKNTQRAVHIIDGYNVINSDSELKVLAKRNLAMARGALDKLAAQYSDLDNCWCIVVYDAYKTRQDRIGAAASTNQEKHNARCYSIFSVEREADTEISLMATYYKKKGSRMVVIVSNDNMVRDNATDRDFIIVSNTAEGWLQNVRSFIKQGGRPQPLAQPRQPMLGTPPPRKAAGKAGPGPEDALTGKLIDSLDASDELREMLECVVDDGLGDGGEEGEEECAVLVLMDSPDMDARDLAAVREWSSSADGTDSDDDSWMPLNADKTFLQPTGTLTDATEEPVAMVPPEVAVMPLSSSLPPQTAALQEQQQQQQPGPASPAAEAGAGSSKPQASTAGQPAPAPMKAQSPKAAGAQQKGTGGAAAGGAKLDSLLGRAGRSRVNDLLADLDLD